MNAIIFDFDVFEFLLLSETDNKEVFFQSDAR